MKRSGNSSEIIMSFLFHFIMIIFKPLIRKPRLMPAGITTPVTPGAWTRRSSWARSRPSFRSNSRTHSLPFYTSQVRIISRINTYKFNKLYKYNFFFLCVWIRFISAFRIMKRIRIRVNNYGKLTQKYQNQKQIMIIKKM